MKKLPYIRQGQQLTIDILNGIIKAINSSILERKEYDSMMADITRMFNSYQSKVDNFILKYQDVVDNTPGLMDLLQSYSTLASMVNGTYIASVGSVNIAAAGFNIQDTMTRSDFETVSGCAERYEQYSSLLITEGDGETTLVYNVAPFESTPIWIEIDRIVGPQGPPGPQGAPGPRGENGENGRDGQITSIKGEAASLNECLELREAPTSGDAYVVKGDNDDVALYVYVGGDHTLPINWVTLNNIRGPAGPQGEMAKITIQYSNNYDGTSPSSSYNGQSFLVLTEEGESDPHIIQISPKLKFEIVEIEESNEATIPSAEHTYIYTRASNEHKIKTKITIPTLKTVEGASLVDNKDLHLKYRGDAGTTKVGRVVYDPSKIIFTNGLADLNISTIREGDVIIDTSANYKIYNYIGDDFVEKGTLQGPQGPVGPVGASFNLVGNWVTYGYTSTGAVTPSAGNVGNAYFLPEDDGDHLLGLYVSSEVSRGDYDWVFAGNSQGPQGAAGARGDIGPRGARITSGEEFYLDDNRVPCAPLNPDNAYKQNDLYLNTATWDLFRVEQIDPAPDYTILPSHVGNIKGEGITNIAFNSAAETLTITYSGGLTEEVDIATIHVSSAEYGEVGLVVHKTDGSDKGVFAIDNTIGEQSDPDVPASFNLWGNETHLKAPSGAGSAGSSYLIPRADHVHPAPATATTSANGLMSSDDKSKLNGIAANANNYTHPANHPASIITQDANNRFVTDSEKSTWTAKASTATASTSANGLMSSTDKTKLDGIAQNANNYTHPSTHPASIIVQDASNRFVTDAEKSTWNGKASTATATTSANGLMSSTDKTRLNGIADNANNYSHPATHPASIITQDANNRFVTDSEKSTWTAKASTATATTSANGLMSSTDKTRLNGIADNANNYSHPATHPASIIVQDASNRFVTDAEKSTWNGKASTATASTSANGLMSSADKVKLNGIEAVYNKVIRTQAEFDALIVSGTWLGAKSVAIVGQFTLSTTNNSGVKIPATVKQIHGFNSAKITITNFAWNATTAKGGLWYATAPTTLDYSIRDLEVSCTGTRGYGFYNCINLSNCTGTGTGGIIGRGFANCNNLSNCTGTGTGTTEGYGFLDCNNLSNCTGKGVDSTDASNGFSFNTIKYAVNCKDGGSSTNMWAGTNKNIDVETCCKTLVTANNTTLNT